MQPSFGQDPFALKKCLRGEALDTVRGVNDNFCEMFHRLDLKYRRHEKLSDAVLCELKSLKVIRDGDNLGLIRMVEVIENCWLDLKNNQIGVWDEHINYGEPDREILTRSSEEEVDHYETRVKSIQIKEYI